MWVLQPYVYLGIMVFLLQRPCAQAQSECPGWTKTIKCKSWSQKLRQCPTNIPSPIIQVSIISEYAKSRGCEYYPGPMPLDYPKGEPGIYGFTDEMIWVEGSCKANFEVCFKDECGIGTGIKCHADASCVWGEDGEAVCRCNEGLYGDGLTSCSKLCRCSASGDPHYKTFDGQMIHYQGVCQYTLVDAGTQECGYMTVNVKNKRSPRNSKVSLANKVTVLVRSNLSLGEVKVDEIVIDQGKKLTINGVKYNGGVSRDSFDVIFKGSNVIVKDRCGMEAMFNGEHTVKVFVPQEYLGVGSGICGDCNGLQDDFKMKNGTDVSDFDNKYSLIGQSYYVPDPDDDIEECRKDDKGVVCTKAVKEMIAKNDLCGYLLDKAGPFKDCIAVLGDTHVQNEYDGCEFDVCANWGSESDVKDQVCSAMAKLHGDCQDNDVTNINFRTADFCPADCGPNMVYDPAISTEIPSCKNRNPSQVVSGPAVEGCKCQEGFLFDDGKDLCVRAEECGCPLDDNYYPVGESFLSDDCSVKMECVNEGGVSNFKEIPAGCGANEVCRAVAAGVGVCECAEDYIRVNDVCEELCNGIRCHENAVCIRGEGVAQCRCKKGLYGNGVTGCSEQCKCSSTGDPHYRTFDGQMIHFQGDCTYTMVDAGSPECGVNVLVKNIRSTRNPKVSLTNKVTVIVKSAAGEDTIVIDQGRALSINGVHYSGGVKRENFEVLQKGDNIIVENNCDMIVQFNGETTAKVLIPKHHAEVASGICGKCNGLQDDYRMKDGTDVSGEVNKYSLIGHSYWVPQTGETEADCLLDDLAVTCTEDAKQQIASNDLCGKIKDPMGPFGECINSLDAQYVEDVYKECEFDVCANLGSDADVTKQVCNAMAKFQGDCNEQPIGYINYRTTDFCPASCGKNMVYDPAINSVQPSCKQPNPPLVVSGGAAEGCKCKNGYLLDEGGNRCVLEEDCGCAVEDNYYPIWYNQLNEDCTVRTQCRLDDGVKVFKAEPTSCGVDAVCNVISPGIGKCECIDDYVRVNGICTASPECTGKKRKIRCKSYYNEYVECPTGETSPITKIWIDFYAPGSHECNYLPGLVPENYQPEEPGIFGFSDYFVWVHNKCRATFFLCLAGTWSFSYPN